MNKKLKKLIFILFVIALSVFLFVSLNLLFMPKYINENHDGRITAEYYREKPDVDVLFVGSSTVNSDINPIFLWENFGITSYDRANASQTSWISYYMIKDAIDCSAPKMVVLDLEFFYQDDNYVEEVSNRKSFDGMRFSRDKFRAIEAAKGEDETYWDYLFPIFRFHTRWKDLGKDDIKYMYYKPYVTFNGYIASDRIEPAAETGMGEFPGAVTLSPRNRMFLEETIKLCKENGLELLLIKTPTSTPKWGPEFDAQIRQIAEENGIAYIDLDEHTDETGIDYSTDTQDGGSHLNDFGAAKLSAYMGNCLRFVYGVADHRGDPAYDAVWSKKCERYHNGR